MGITSTWSLKSATLLMVLHPLEDDCGPTLLMGLTPTKNSAEFVALLMGLTPLEDDCKPTLLMDFIPTQSLAEPVAPLMSLISTQR